MTKRILSLLLVLFALPAIALSDSSFKELDIVAVIPSEFLINPNTGLPLAINNAQVESEVRTAINIASEYFKPLNIKLNVVKVVIQDKNRDPYQGISDAYRMLEKAIELHDTYNIDYDIGIVVGRGSFGGTYGLTYEGVSCTHPKFAQIFVTTSGVNEQKSFSLAHSIAHEIGHVIGMSHDNSNIDGQSSLMAANYVAKPYGFSVNSISKAHNRISGQGGACLNIQHTEDTDFDGYTDEIEENHGSNIDDGGSLPNLPSKSWYGSWNSFLQLINIVELINRSENTNLVEIRLKDISGAIVETKKFLLQPYSQFDVILNEWSEFKVNSYGTLEILADELLDGRVSLYSMNSKGVHSFSTSIPFIKSQIGISNVTFNTFYPYSKTSFDYVQNWLTLVNLDSQQRSFRVSSFDADGNVIKTKVYTLSAFSRFDVDAGHELIDISRVGMQQIVPELMSMPYIAFISRYGFSGDKNKQNVEFASVQIAKHASGSKAGNTILAKNKGFSYLEISNSKSATTSFNLKVYLQNGLLASSKYYNLSGFSQIHIPVSDAINNNGSSFGNFVIEPNISESITTELYDYKLGTKPGEVVTANLPTSEIYDNGTKNLSGSYNLFLGANNYVYLNNFESSQIELNIKNSGNIIETISIPANSTKMLSLRDLQYFAAKDSSYGALEIEASANHQYSAALLREGKINSAFADLMLESNFR